MIGDPISTAEGLGNRINYKNDRFMFGAHSHENFLRLLDG